MAVMISGIPISQEIFANDIITALKPCSAIVTTIWRSG